MATITLNGEVVDRIDVAISCPGEMTRLTVSRRPGTETLAVLDLDPKHVAGMMKPPPPGDPETQLGRAQNALRDAQDALQQAEARRDEIHAECGRLIARNAVLEQNVSEALVYQRAVRDTLEPLLVASQGGR